MSEMDQTISTQLKALADLSEASSKTLQQISETLNKVSTSVQELVSKSKTTSGSGSTTPAKEGGAAETAGETLTDQIMKIIQDNLKRSTKDLLKNILSGKSLDEIWQDLKNKIRDAINKIPIADKKKEEPQPEKKTESPKLTTQSEGTKTEPEKTDPAKEKQALTDQILKIIQENFKNFTSNIFKNILTGKELKFGDLWQDLKKKIREAIDKLGAGGEKTTPTPTPTPAPTPQTPVKAQSSAGNTPEAGTGATEQKTLSERIDQIVEDNFKAFASSIITNILTGKELHLDDLWKDFKKKIKEAIDKLPIAEKTSTTTPVTTDPKKATEGGSTPAKDQTPAADQPGAKNGDGKNGGEKTGESMDPGQTGDKSDKSDKSELTTSKPMPITGIGDAWQRGVQTAASTTVDAIFQDVLNGKMKSFGDYLKSLANNIVQSFANNMLSKLVNNLTGIFFKAEGGPVTGGGTYIVGERGPEVFVPNTSGTIIPHHQLGSGKQAAPQVTVNVINNSGQQVTAKQESHFDGQRYVVDVWLDALARNVGGVRDVVYAGR